MKRYLFRPSNKHFHSIFLKDAGIIKNFASYTCYNIDQYCYWIDFNIIIADSSLNALHWKRKQNKQKNGKMGISNFKGVDTRTHDKCISRIRERNFKRYFLFRFNNIDYSNFNKNKSTLHYDYLCPAPSIKIYIHAINYPRIALLFCIKWCFYY